MNKIYKTLLFNLFLFPVIAFGQLNIANSTISDVWVAIGYTENGQWYSEGWWEVESGEKVQVYNKSLSNSYYYIYAYQTGIGDGVWKGTASFCAPSNVFYLDYQNCSESQKKGFRKIDVGDSQVYTISLTQTASYGGILPNIQSVRN